MASRALIPLEDLRRWAKVAREERVTIHGRVDGKGGISFRMSPAAEGAAEEANDLDARLDAFGAL